MKNILKAICVSNYTCSSSGDARFKLY